MSTFDRVADSVGLSPLFVIRKTFAAGAGGGADDVTIYDGSAPSGLRIIDTIVIVATTALLASVQLRDATGGGGSALSASIAATVQGRVRDTSLSCALVPAAGTIVLRRSNNTVAGELIVLVRLEA